MGFNPNIATEELCAVTSSWICGRINNTNIITFTENIKRTLLHCILYIMVSSWSKWICVFSTERPDNVTDWTERVEWKLRRSYTSRFIIKRPLWIWIQMNTFPFGLIQNNFILLSRRLITETILTACPDPS